MISTLSSLRITALGNRSRNLADAMFRLHRCRGVREQVMTLVERFDAEVGKEADNQQFGHDVHDGVVGLRLRHPGEDTVI